MERLYVHTPKHHTAGTHRARPPEETFAEYSRFMAALGITRVANVTGLDWIGLPVYNAIRPNSRSLSVSQGKGIDHPSAKVSALMESIEYWHGEHIDKPLLLDSHQRISSRLPVIDVSKLPLRAGLDGIGAQVRETPARATLRLDLPYLWIEGHDLFARSPIWVPYEAVQLNKVGIDYAATTFRVASCGLASGNNVIEATIHAICELVERDALTLWWSNAEPDLVGTKIDPGTISDEGCRQILERYDAAGIDVAIWEVTSDVGVPTFQCCIIEREERSAWRPFGACWGYGCHLSPAVALSRALTEAAQSRITTIAASRDDNFRGQYASHADADKLRATREVLFETTGRRSFDACASRATSTFDSDLEVLREALRAVGVQSVVVVDLSHEELGIPVVKVIIPALEFYSLYIGYEPGERARPNPQGAPR